MLSLGLLFHFGFHRVQIVLRAAQHIEDLNHSGQDILLRWCSARLFALVRTWSTERGGMRELWSGSRGLSSWISLFYLRRTATSFPNSFAFTSAFAVARTSGQNLSEWPHFPHSWYNTVSTMLWCASTHPDCHMAQCHSPGMPEPPSILALKVSVASRSILHSPKEPSPCTILLRCTSMNLSHGL